MKPKQNLTEVIAIIYPNLFLIRSEYELVKKLFLVGGLVKSVLVITLFFYLISEMKGNYSRSMGFKNRVNLHNFSVSEKHTMHFDNFFLISALYTSNFVNTKMVVSFL